MLNPFSLSHNLSEYKNKNNYNQQQHFNMKLILSLVVIGCALQSSEGRIKANNRPQEEDTEDLPEFDCSKGCPLKRKDMGPKVCGDDNITYYNRCLAVCQGKTWYRL